MWALESGSPASGKTAATFIDCIHPKNQHGKNKESRNEIEVPTNRVACIQTHPYHPAIISSNNDHDILGTNDAI